MKKLLLTALLAVGMVVMCHSAKAGIPIIYSTGPEFVTLQNLPDSVEIDGEHVNFGVGFKQFAIFWIPMWNYGETEYVAVTNDGRQAWALDADQLDYVSQAYGLDTSKAPRIPFWHRMGGKIILGCVLLFILWNSLKDKNKREEDEEDEEEHEAADPKSV